MGLQGQTLARIDRVSTDREIFDNATTTFTYTERGNVAQTSTDTGSNGSIDGVTIYDYSCWED